MVADSQTCDMNKILLSEGINKVQFVIMHPPYWDIVKFSENPNDLSNCDSINEFLDSFSKVIDNSLSVLEKNRYCAVVIGDKYANSQVIPLGFYCMNLMMEKGLLLKAILVKNFGETKGKSNKQGIWRYRALASDFYIFKHEYILYLKGKVIKITLPITNRLYNFLKVNIIFAYIKSIILGLMNRCI